MSDLDHHISKWLHPSNESFFTTTIGGFDEVEWLHDPYEAVPEYVETPSFPRVIPPNPRPHSMIEKPGVKDHSRLKHLLREWL